jgi:CRISPR-associated DxTHG motif protein
VDIPDGRDPEQVRQIVQSVANEVPAGADLTLDITQGFRHFPFLFYAASLYLQSLRGVRIRGAYYGMLEGAPPPPCAAPPPAPPAAASNEPRPIIDLQPLLELPEWFHAVRVFRETGSVKPMSKLLANIPATIRQAATDAGHNRPLHEKARAAKRLLENLERLGFAHDAALPLELGQAACEFASELSERFSDVMGTSLPFTAELAASLRQAMSPLQLAGPLPRKGDWKTAVVLDQSELDRQARLIDLYLSRQQFPLAFGLMREWIVSWCMHRKGTGGGWLRYGKRKPFERRLGALAAFLNPKNQPEGVEPTPEQKGFGSFWHQLSDELRNAFHHHGMREGEMIAQSEATEQVVDFWNKLKKHRSAEHHLAARGDLVLPDLGGGGGCLLISPQGSRPGVLYSALKCTSPHRCLVICSPLSESKVEEAAAKAAFSGRLERLIIQDAFSGFDELEGLVKQARKWLFDADGIVANLTGGTTLMGIGVQKLVETAERMDRPARRFALIDRRPSAEQEENPYVASDVHWLDAEPEGDPDGDD